MLLPAGPDSWPRSDPGLPGEIAALVGTLSPVDGDQLPWDGADLPWDRADIELVSHDGHAPGHTALWLADSRVLIAGDMLSEVELPLLERIDAGRSTTPA